MALSNTSKVHYKYRSQLLTIPTSKVIKVLMIGNNPREMGCLSDHLRRFAWKKFNVTATFDLKTGWRLAHSQRPDYILLDGSLPAEAIKAWVHDLRRRRAFDQTAIAILKEDNATQLVIPGIQDYLLKDTIVSDTFALTVLNAMRMKVQENRSVAKSAVGSWWPWSLLTAKNSLTS